MMSRPPSPDSPNSLSEIPGTVQEAGGWIYRFIVRAADNYHDTKDASTHATGALPSEEADVGWSTIIGALVGPSATWICLGATGYSPVMRTAAASRRLATHAAR